MNPTHPTTNKSATADDRSRPSSAVPAAPADASNISFWNAWPWWLPPALIALLLVLYFVDPFVGDWDGMDYTMLSLAGYPSSMALGRNLFIFGNHALYEIAHRLFNVQPSNAYLIFKYAVVVQVPFAVTACWVLARDFTQSVYSATLAALFIVCSPVFVLYGGQVMTDVPSVLLLASALIIHYRGLSQNRVWMVMLGAALLGFGMNLRETFSFYVPWLILAPFVCGWKIQRRQILLVALSFLLFLACAGGWFAYWFITVDHYREIWFGWRESMRQETARHPITLQNLKPYLTYFFVSAPVVFLTIAFAIRNEWRERRLSPLLLLGLSGLLADFLLFLNYSTSVNWRYFLTGLPALAPLSANFLLRTLSRRFGRKVAFVSSIVAVLAFAVVFSLLIRPASRQFIERRAMSKDYRYRLEKLPRDAVMISGSQTIAVTYWKAMGLGEWETIGTGGGWPGENLVPLIEKHLSDGRRVFLDADPRWWLPCGWQRDEIPVIVRLQEKFRLRPVTDTIYELRPPFEKGKGADEHPHLERLLPENRPEDTKKCPQVSS